MNASDDHKQSTRVEREILEILERAESAPPPPESLQTTLRRQTVAAREQLTQATAGRQRITRLSGEVLRIAGAILLAFAAAALPGSFHFLAVLLAIASALIFFSLWIPAGPSVPGGPPRWRGQDLRGDDPPGPRLPRR